MRLRNPNQVIRTNDLSTLLRLLPQFAGPGSPHINGAIGDEPSPEDTASDDPCGLPRVIVDPIGRLFDPSCGRWGRRRGRYFEISKAREVDVGKRGHRGTIACDIYPDLGEGAGDGLE